MALIKDGEIVRDPWALGQEDGEADSGVPVVVSLEDWQARREDLLRRNGPLGIRLASDQSPALIADDLDRFDLVALEFPKFTDGRAFSYARLLRERYGFKGEVRAVGNVLRDQFLFMHRCGIDSYEVVDEKAAAAWQQSMSEIAAFYQPATDGRVPIGNLRRWRQLGCGVSRDGIGPATRPNRSEPAAPAARHDDPTRDEAEGCAAFWAF